MKNKVWLILPFIALGFVLFYWKPEIEEQHHHEDKKGPHQGRLLQSENLQTEVTIYEPEGIPPKFRIYFYSDGKEIDPSEVKYKMKLERINRVETIPFAKRGDYLESLIEASEPHSFKVDIDAEYQGKMNHWDYETFEGRVTLTPEAIEANSIKIQKAMPQELEKKLSVMGKIVPNEEQTVHISPRFPGVVKAVYKKLGDEVTAGETLALIESNESLQNYEIKSEISGRVIKKDINLGMSLNGQEVIFVVSDLKTVWADFNIYRHDLPLIKIGQLIDVKSLDGTLKGSSIISYISPLGHESTQSVTVRAVLSNSDERFFPGLFISGNIVVEKVIVPLAIQQSALQTFRDWNVVFLAIGNTFEVVPVTLGKQSGEFIEVISGLKAGDSYVAENSFIIKADLEKSGAKHEH